MNVPKRAVDVFVGYVRPVFLLVNTRTPATGRFVRDCIYRYRTHTRENIFLYINKRNALCRQKDTNREIKLLSGFLKMQYNRDWRHHVLK